MNITEFHQAVMAALAVEPDKEVFEDLDPSTDVDDDSGVV